jgi:hypothetical protein
MTSHANRKLEHCRTAGLSLKEVAKLLLRWRRLGSSPARRVAHAIVLMLALLFCCCKSRAEGAQPRAERTQIARGDRVVVEPAAAHFFEGTVLSVEGDRLRVQKADTGDAVTVALSDVYLLPSHQLLETPGFAVCERGPRDWTGCRVEAIRGETFQVLDPTGVRIEIARSHVLKPSPVTVLNVKRQFERASTRAEFVRSSVKAGNPHVPSNWKPSAGERVLALSNGEWYSAHVREFEDDGVYVRWADNRISKVVTTDVAPEPPYTSELRRGDYVLVRPTSPSQPWTRQLVRSTSTGEVRVQNVEGDVRALSQRDVAPLGK